VVSELTVCALIMTGWDIRVTGCDTGISGVGVKVTDFDFRVEWLIYKNHWL
jgi:hypothetical protein